MQKNIVLLLVLVSLAVASACSSDEATLDSPLIGANGMFFDAHDKLYIASVNSGAVFVLDPETAEAERVYGSDFHVTSPDDVTIGPDGHIYVTNILQGTVAAIDPDGSARVIANLGLGVNSVTLDEEGDVWIGRDFLGDGLYELDQDMDWKPRVVIESPGWINAMDFGPDGMLYGPVYTKFIVVKVDPSTGEMTTVADGFDPALHAVKFDSQWRLHVVESRPGRVLRIDLNTGQREVVAQYAPGIDNLAFDSRDRLYISSYFDGTVHEVLQDGSLRQLRPPSAASKRAAIVGMYIIPALLVATPFIVLPLAIVYFWRWLRRHRAPS